MLYFDYLEKIIKEHGSIAAFNAEGESITYAEADQEAARIYRYLREKRIGKEQIVMILMPKGLHFFSCMLGVLRAGAAFVLVQDDYPVDRIDFIRKDSGCVLVLDQALFDKVQESVKPLEGFEQTDPHQLAYLVYTSGSTGTPKGVLHEYGNLDEVVNRSYSAAPKLPFERPLLGPLSFVQSIMNVFNNTMLGITTCLEPETKLRDFEDMKKYIFDKKLKTIYLPPSYIRLYKEPSPYLEVIGTGSESACGIYYPGGKPAILNTYSCSEAGFPVMQFLIDRPYDNAPIGTPMPGVEAVLMDEEDHIIEGAGQGELCFKNDYFRGYLHQLELSRKAKRGGFYHTFDLCARDAQGIYTIIGRMDDMIKINGNRIELAEIEAAVQRCTGLSKVVARGFEEEKRSFAAVYYIKEEAEKLGILDGKRLVIDLTALERILPQYMMPTYYVPIDALPLTASGKIDRKQLAAPKEEDWIEEYAAPENETERYLCDKMEKVLNVDRIGATDDFFALGGDSMRSIELVSECEKLVLSSKQIYRLRTPREIAKHVMKRGAFSELVEKNKRAMEKEWPLLPGQHVVIHFQEICPNSGFANVSTVVRFRDTIDPVRMEKAVNWVLKSHPAIYTRIYQNPEGKICQRYEPGFYECLSIQKMTEEEFAAVKNDLTKPLPIFDSKLYRGGLVQTEKGLYFYFIMNHVVVEGSTVNLLMTDIFNTYLDQDKDRIPDCYFSLLEDMTELRNGKGFHDAERYYGELFDEKLRSGVPIGLKTDHESLKRTEGKMILPEAFAVKGNRDGIFYMTASMLASAWYNGTNFSFLGSVYAQRDDPVRMASAGFMSSGLTFGLDISKYTKPKKMLEEIWKQNSYGIAHTEYNYSVEKNMDSSLMVRFNYLKGILDWKDDSEYIAETITLPRSEEMPGALMIVLAENRAKGKTTLTIAYAKEIYEKKHMERFAELFVKAVNYLESDGDIGSI